MDVNFMTSIMLLDFMLHDSRQMLLMKINQKGLVSIRFNKSDYFINLMTNKHKKYIISW